MDDFGDHPGLTGTLISMEFGPGGRIHQLWASDPSLPEEGDEFQFVLTPVSFGEEFAEDYYPGTILIGARQNPDEPWILSRNAEAEPLEEEDARNGITFNYEFPLLPEIRASGRFYEIPGPIPQIVWDVTLRNSGRKSIEIGELAFPFALNNLYEGFAKTDRGVKTLYSDRVYIHKFIGGAASYFFAQRMNAEPPGLLIFPGDDTSWEFYNHVSSSLNTPYRWEGIPVAYVHSRAAFEREGWSNGLTEPTSMFLEGGESKVFQTRFVPADRDRTDNLHQTLATCGRPAMKLLPSAVAPADVGVAIEIGGTTPARFFGSKDVDIETDADEEGGFCFVKPKDTGRVRMSFEDVAGRTSYADLMFIPPIEQLIHSRAKWIVENQVCNDPKSALDSAILVANIKTGKQLTDAEDYAGPFGVEGGLSDALFLAEKNCIYPDRQQIGILDKFIEGFLLDDIQNPGDFSVGSAFADTRSVALNYGSPQAYTLVFNLYHSMYRVASLYGETANAPKEYLERAYRTAMALFKHGLPRESRGVGLVGYSQIFDMLNDMSHEGMEEELERLMPYVTVRAQDMLRREYPYAGDTIWDTAAFEEVFTAARYLNDEEHQERALRCSYSAKSLSPCWWWYGSDMRQFEEWEGPHPAIADKGELCLGYTTAANARMFLDTLDRDYSRIPEAYMRLAFGGMLGVWALVRPDGAASLGYCPDVSSKQYGFNPLTGDLGLALFHYLRGTGAYVLPSRNYGVFTFGCHFEVDGDAYTVRPWDGVGRRIVLRQVGSEFEVNFGKIKEVRMDVRKRWASIIMESPADKDVYSELRVRGLWGKTFDVLGNSIQAVDGELAIRIPLSAGKMSRIEIKVSE